MKRNVLLMFCVIGFLNAGFAQKYATRTGIISFEASVPAFEQVAATNSSVSAILDPSNGQIAALALMNGFRFKVALMEEHFNENYAESDKYPKASFKGTIEGFDVKKLTDKKVAYTVKGDLTLHGKTKNITCTSYLYIKDSVIYMDGSFVTKPGDFNIEIPKIVSNKIADEVHVAFNFQLKQ